MKNHDDLLDRIRCIIKEANETFDQKAAQYLKNNVQLSDAEFRVCTLCDPTSNGTNAGKYFDWLHRQFQNYSEFMSSNADFVKQLLNSFNTRKVLLQRNGFSVNIQDYSTLEQLRKAVETVNDKFSVLAKQFAGQFDVVYDDDKFTVIHCKTWDAERAFGKYSHWCTAVLDNDRYYKIYNCLNCLFIFIPKVNGIPDITSDYIMQCDVSNGPYGEGEYQFHCADKADKVYKSFTSYFRRYPQYADPEACQYLHDNYNELFQPMTSLEVEEDYDEKTILVADMLECEPSEIEWTDDTYIETPNGGFYVYNREEAIEAAKNDVREFAEEDLNYGEMDHDTLVDYLSSYWVDDFKSSYVDMRMEDLNYEEAFTHNENGETREDYIENLKDSIMEAEPGDEAYSIKQQFEAQCAEDESLDLEDLVSEYAEANADNENDWSYDEDGKTEDQVRDEIYDDVSENLGDYISELGYDGKTLADYFDFERYANDRIQDIDDALRYIGYDRDYEVYEDATNDIYLIEA